MPKSDLIDAYIELNPNRPVLADAWLRNYSVPVWALIGYLEAVHGDLARVAADYDIPLDAVRAAVADCAGSAPLPAGPRTARQPSLSLQASRLGTTRWT